MWIASYNSSTKTKAGVKGVDKLQANLDYKQTLKPLKGEKKPRYIKGSGYGITYS